MRKITLALLACAALTVPTVAAKAGGDTTTPEAPAPVAAPCADRATIKSAYADRHWRVADPLAEKPCAGLERFTRKARERHHRWREYRQLAHYHSGCHAGGRWLRFTTVPGYVVQHESGCSWTARNPDSGACGPYQLNGWTSCDTSTWFDKMRHHRTAKYVLEHQGLGPAWTSNW